MNKYNERINKIVGEGEERGKRNYGGDGEGIG